MKQNKITISQLGIANIIKLNLFLLIIALSVSCNTYHYLNIMKTRVGMSKHEVLAVLMQDSNLVNIIGAKTYGFCRGDIWEYANYERYQYRNSKKYMQKNPLFKVNNGFKSRYWLAFFNDSLKYVKNGNATDWKVYNEIDSLIVRELRNRNSDKLKVVLKIMSIEHK